MDSDTQAHSAGTSVTTTAASPFSLSCLGEASSSASSGSVMESGPHTDNTTAGEMDKQRLKQYARAVHSHKRHTNTHTM